MNKITAHVLVKNEARFLWFSVMSAIDYVDKVVVWNDRSTDGSERIIKEIKRRYPEKVDVFSSTQKNIVNFLEIRKEMLSLTKTEWILMLDADEIWWDDSIDKITKIMRVNGIDKIESIVVPTKVLVGDIYHYQEEAAGMYNLAGRKGNLSLRGVNTKIPGLSSTNPHGTWGWTDEDEKMIQDREKIVYVDAPFIHATFLRRSSTRDDDKKVFKRAKKLKHEIGISFPKDFYFPEVFFRERPDFVESPWTTMSFSFRLRALFETPLRRLKRRIIKSKVGY